jgi:hypothetical protein
MSFASWQELYASDLQALYALWIAPALFLPFVAFDLRRRWLRVPVEPAASEFFGIYALVFTIETMLDPLTGGPVLRWLGIADAPVAMVVVFFFVLLGDFRVFVLVFALPALRAGRGLAQSLVEAAVWTLVVPITTLIIHRALTALAGELPAQSMWLIYELGFITMALVLRERVVPARIPPNAARLHAYLRAVLAYVIGYYALWAAADVLILAGIDWGWALRIVPNQLYYALFVPFVYLLAYSRRYAATSSSTQPSR